MAAIAAHPAAATAVEGVLILEHENPRQMRTRAKGKVSISAFRFVALRYLERAVMVALAGTAQWRSPLPIAVNGQHEVRSGLAVNAQELPAQCTPSDFSTVCYTEKCHRDPQSCAETPRTPNPQPSPFAMPQRKNTGMSDVTTLLEAARAGDGPALDQLCSVMYRELHGLAHARLRRSAQITLLDTTSLVHESYLRLLKVGRLNVTDRSHFLAYAARVMRSIIMDFVRQRRAERRGGDQLHVTLSTDIADAVHVAADQVIRIDDALEDLGKVDARLVKVVEMRYFAGMSEQEIAECLGVTDRTVRRDWEKARLLLSAALQ